MITFKWPPQNSTRIAEATKYLKYEKIGKKGYPEIVEKFERKFKKIIGTKYALTFNSGTSALLASFFSAKIKKNDKVIVPSLTFHATASPLINFKPKIIFCGCDEVGNISIHELTKKITKNIKLVIITHIGGHPCEMDEILFLKKRYNFLLIEDCSHAHLSSYKGKKVGTFGDMAIFSMDRNKLLSTGEGGVLVTNNKNFYERALIYSDFGPRLETINNYHLKRYKETGLGHKLRIHPISAAIAYSELGNLKKYIKLRKIRLKFLTDEINKISGLMAPITKSYVDRGAFYSYRVFFKNKYINKNYLDYFIKTCKKLGIDVRKSGNRPLHLLSLFNIKKKEKVVSAENFYNNTVSLPTFTFESKKIIKQYIVKFKKAYSILNKTKKHH